MSDLADQLYERLLVLRCQTGEADAFAELVARYDGRLRYYLRKLLGDAHRADDARQEVWCDVVRGLDRLAEAGAFRAWLYRIARDRAYRTLRQRSPAHRPLNEDDLNGTAADDADFGPEDAERVHAALNELLPEHREVLVLRFIEEMSYEEVARVAGCPVGTVRSRLHYAKRALRRVLERSYDHERE